MTRVYTIHVNDVYLLTRALPSMFKCDVTSSGKARLVVLPEELPASRDEIYIEMATNLLRPYKKECAKQRPARFTPFETVAAQDTAQADIGEEAIAKANERSGNIFSEETIKVILQRELNSRRKAEMIEQQAKEGHLTVDFPLRLH